MDAVHPWPVAPALLEVWRTASLGGPEVPASSRKRSNCTMLAGLISASGDSSAFELHRMPKPRYLAWASRSPRVPVTAKPQARRSSSALASATIRSGAPWLVVRARAAGSCPWQGSGSRCRSRCWPRCRSGRSDGGRIGVSTRLRCRRGCCCGCGWRRPVARASVAGLPHMPGAAAGDPARSVGCQGTAAALARWASRRPPSRQCGPSRPGKPTACCSALRPAGR